MDIEQDQQTQNKQNQQEQKQQQSLITRIEEIENHLYLEFKSKTIKQKMLILPFKELFTENLPKFQATKEKIRLNNVKRTYKAICNSQWSIKEEDFQRIKEIIIVVTSHIKNLTSVSTTLKNWQRETSLDPRECKLFLTFILLLLLLQ